MRISIGKHKILLFNHKKETNTIIGLTSLTDGKHVLFCDFDNIEYFSSTVYTVAC